MKILKASFMSNFEAKNSCGSICFLMLILVLSWSTNSKLGVKLMNQAEAIFLPVSSEITYQHVTHIKSGTRIN